jgi:hypothetical protein
MVVHVSSAGGRQAGRTERPTYRPPYGYGLGTVPRFVPSAYPPPHHVDMFSSVNPRPILLIITTPTPNAPIGMNWGKGEKGRGRLLHSCGWDGPHFNPCGCKVAFYDFLNPTNTSS